jgi:CheY-like chemotaxis protein/HPt (histidine-containing phosphotransfer) domain-containing protein
MRSKRKDQTGPSALAPSPTSRSDAGRATDTIFDSMDHQIHTAMNGVIGMLELLHGTDLTPAQQEFTNMAQTSAENLLKLFNGMLDFSRISAGKMALEHLPFDLFTAVENVCIAHQPKASQKGIELKVHSAPDIQRLMIGDAGRISQVLTILIGDAIERVSSGQVRVDIEAIAQNDGRCRLCVCVSDTGGVMPGDEFTGIFNGSRAIVATNPQHGPLQMGLALSKSLIELMDGQCGADYVDGRGSKFWFSLNLPLAAGVLHGVRVLMLDDQVSNLRVFEQHLRQQAMRADSFSSPSAALGALAEAQATNDPYRIAILNHQMAEMDGETLGAAIRTDVTYRDTLLVILSPESSPAHADRFKRAGFSASIAKPVNRQILSDTLAILCACLNSKKILPFVVDAVMQCPESVEEESSAPLAGHRILVVDDNVANYQIAIGMLQSMGCKADVATDGQTAVAMHESQAYDLILMDCQMPGLNGYEASAMIRAAEANRRHTPIVGWTTNTLPDERKKCAESGMDDLIAKPIRAQALQEILSRWLRQVGGERAGLPGDAESDDLESMRDLFGPNFAELAALYQDDVPKRLAALELAAAAEDAAQMAKMAHSLSGSCASIGATRLAALCQELELRCRAGLSQNHEPGLAAIKAEYARIDAKLDAMVQSIAV